MSAAPDRDALAAAVARGVGCAIEPGENGEPGYCTTHQSQDPCEDVAAVLSALDDVLPPARPAPGGDEGEAVSRVADFALQVERGFTPEVALLRVYRVPGRDVAADLRTILAALDRRWQDGYEAGCAAAHDIGCSAVEGERDALREELARRPASPGGGE